MIDLGCQGLTHLRYLRVIQIWGPHFDSSATTRQLGSINAATSVQTDRSTCNMSATGVSRPSDRSEALKTTGPR